VDGPMHGGAMAPPPDAKLERDMWLPYVQVEDCDATADRAVSLGGRIAAPPMDIPTVGRIAVLLDPEFATLAIWTPSA
jgi:predicted enzyme related to lactoylglutathione lyase